MIAVSRKVIDELTDYLKEYHHVKGLAWMKNVNEKFEGGIKFSQPLQSKIIEDLRMNDNDIIFMIGDTKITLEALGALRFKLGKKKI